MKALFAKQATPFADYSSTKLKSRADRMIQRSRVRAVLSGVTRSVTNDPNLYEDLLQEALVYIWKQLQRPPLQRWSWYLQRCRFRLKDELRRGRSLDAFKRRNLAATLSIADDNEAN